MSALCLYIGGLMVGTPCKTCHPPAEGWQKFSARFACYLPPLWPKRWNRLWKKISMKKWNFKFKSNLIIPYFDMEFNIYYMISLFLNGIFRNNPQFTRFPRPWDWFSSIWNGFGSILGMRKNTILKRVKTPQ